MSEPTDIKALDEYLKGDSDISQRYRELGRDEVPPELDRRVLAAARDAVASAGAKRSRSWVRWSAPVALAASVVLVLTVVLEGGLEQTPVLTQAPQESYTIREKSASEAEEARRADELVRQPEIVAQPAAAPPTLTAPAAEALAKAEAERLAGAHSVAPPPEITVEAQSPDAPAPVDQISVRKPVERSEAEADSSDVSEVAVTGSHMRRATGRAAGPRNTVSTRAFSRAQATPDEQREQSDPQAWLEDIRAMRRAGKTAEADREWQRFREAFPDFQVADDDIARKQP